MLSGPAIPAHLRIVPLRSGGKQRRWRMLWGPALGESESVAWVQAASLEIPESVAGTMRHAGARDERLAAEIVRSTARQAVSAWAMAVDGDATTLAAMAQPDAAHWLLHPVWKSWQVAAGPKVTEIAIWDLEADARPPRLRIEFRFTGWRRFLMSSSATYSPAAVKHRRSTGSAVAHQQFLP